MTSGGGKAGTFVVASIFLHALLPLLMPRRSGPAPSSTTTPSREEVPLDLSEIVPDDPPLAAPHRETSQPTARSMARASSRAKEEPSSEGEESAAVATPKSDEPFQFNPLARRGALPPLGAGTGNLVIPPAGPEGDSFLSRRMTSHLADRLDAADRVRGFSRLGPIKMAIEDAVRAETREELDVVMSVEAFSDGRFEVTFEGGGRPPGDALMAAILRRLRSKSLRIPEHAKGLRGRFRVRSDWQFPSGGRERDLGVSGPKLVTPTKEKNEVGVEIFKAKGKVASVGLVAKAWGPKPTVVGKCSVDDPCAPKDATLEKIDQLAEQSFGIGIGLEGGLTLENLGATASRIVRAEILSEERISDRGAGHPSSSTGPRQPLEAPILPSRTAPSGSASP